MISHFASKRNANGRPSSAAAAPEPAPCNDPPRRRLVPRYGTMVYVSEPAGILIAERLADEHHGDAAGDLLVLDDQDLAALAFRSAARGVVAAAGGGARRAFAELAALLHRGSVADALERRGEIGHELVRAGEEQYFSGAEGVAGEAVAAAVDVDDLARLGDGVGAADQPVGNGRLAPAAGAFLA